MILRYVVTSLGTLVMGVSISILILLNKGVDTISVLYLGLQKQFGLELWASCLIFNLLVILIVLWCDHSQLGIGTVINFIGLSVSLKVFPVLLAPLCLKQMGGQLHLPLLIGSVCLFGIGCGLYTAGQLGSAALEALSLVVKKKTSFSLRNIRIVLDGLLVIIGAILGATIGIGTILCVVLVGPITQSILSLSKYRVSEEST
ncbi:YczE/YyaS/YitT family protein [Enterococcus sp. AZ109]|uniref:YczE/YyaS/YitT family protein n=1 Tax=Enterococcus sp. AZ109 TaxID=2774634 RepID=UPI003F29BAEE